MKRSTLLCLSSAGLSAVLLSTAFASHSSSVKIDGSVGAAEACTKQGGVVSTVADGQMCTTPPSRCVSSSQSGATYSVDPNSTDLVAACFDACGKIIPAQDGTATCKIKAAAVDRHEVPFGPMPAPISVAKPTIHPR